MQQAIYDIGECKKGSIVEVRLSASTNVRLMDKVNRDLMAAGQDYKFYGGYITASPCRIAIPETRRWFVMIEVDGKLQHTVGVRPPRLTEGVNEIKVKAEE